MKTILTLLTLLACLRAQAATTLIGGIRRNYDTTGTNTTTSAITISGGLEGTNLYAGMLVATNSVSVGQAGEDGIITITSSDTTNTVTITMDSAGQFRMTPTTPDNEAAFVLNMSTSHATGPALQLQNNGNIIFSVDSQSGWTNSGALFMSDRGLFEPVAGGAGVTNIFDTIYVTNITFLGTNVDFTTNFYFNGTYITNISQTGGATINNTNGVIPVRVDANTFADSQISTNGTNIIISGNTYIVKQSRLGTDWDAKNSFAGLSTSLAGEVVLAERNYDGSGITSFWLDSLDKNDSSVAAWALMQTRATVSTTNSFLQIRAGDTENVQDWIIRGNAHDTNTSSGTVIQFTITASGHDLTPVLLRPLAASGTTPYKLGSGNTLSSGDILDIANNSTNVFTVGAKGTVKAIDSDSGAIATIGFNAGGNATLTSSSGFLYALSILASQGIQPQSDNTYQIGTSGSGYSDVWSTDFHPKFSTGHIYWNNSTNTVFDAAGTGSPESVVTAGVGSTWRRLDGGASTSFYVKESGAGNTGWIGK